MRKFHWIVKYITSHYKGLFQANGIDDPDVKEAMAIQVNNSLECELHRDMRKRRRKIFAIIGADTVFPGIPGLGKIGMVGHVNGIMESDLGDLGKGLEGIKPKPLKIRKLKFPDADVPIAEEQSMKEFGHNKRKKRHNGR